MTLFGSLEAETHEVEVDVSFEVAPHPTNVTTANINRICFMPATLRLTGSGVNAVGGGERVTSWRCDGF